MPLITLVRHGEAAAGFGEDADPGLSPLGRSQSAAVADALSIGPPLDVLTSPLRRCRETAAPLAGRWSTEAIVEPRVAEIPSPTEDLAARSSWLQGVMAGTWSEQSAAVRAWADDVVAALTALERDTVVFSHFVAINVAVSRATGDDRVVNVRAGNCSRTLLEVADGRLILREPPVDVATTTVL